MLEIPTPIWHVKAETARAVRQRIRSVLEWAIAMDLRNDNPCDRVLPALGPRNDIVTHRQAATGALGAFVEEHRTALTNDAARRTGRAPRPSPTASPNIAPRVNTRTPCGSWHARAPPAPGNERRQVQSSQQLGVTLGQPGGLAGNAPRFLPPDRTSEN